MGYSSLYISAKNGHEDVCKLLLGDNADVNNQNNYGFTSLHLGDKSVLVRVCILLFHYNVDVNKQDSDGFTSLHLAAQKGKMDACRFLLQKIHWNMILDVRHWFLRQSVFRMKFVNIYWKIKQWSAASLKIETSCYIEQSNIKTLKFITFYCNIKLI